MFWQRPIGTLYFSFLCLAVSVSLWCCNAAYASSTLAAVTDRGMVRCGVPVDLPGFAATDGSSQRQGFNIDFCRALAAATLGDANAVLTLPVSSIDGTAALLVKDIDVLINHTPWTLTQDAEMGEVVGVMFHDGQGFLSRQSDNVQSAQQLSNRSVCVQRNTDAYQTAEAYFKQQRMAVTLKKYRSWSKAVAAYAAGKCSVLTASRSVLSAVRSGLVRPNAHHLLPDVISKQPYGPMVRHHDSAWVDITRWVLNCWITAEELGIDRDSVNRGLKSRLSSVQRLLGRKDDIGGALGLSGDWCYRVIALVGNYGDSYQRHIGAGSALNLPRGLNALWNRGGILYAPPIR